MKFLALILILILLISGCAGKPTVADDKNTNQKTGNSCSSNADCSTGNICYNPTECGLGPDGPVPCPLRDDLCHNECESDSDCPPSAPRCLWAPQSDYGGYQLCFK